MKFNFFNELNIKLGKYRINKPLKSLVVISIATLSLLLMIFLSYKIVSGKEFYQVFSFFESKEKIEEREVSEIIKKMNPVKNKVVILWDMMYGEKFENSRFDGLDHVDVLSPTWFQVQNEKGALINRMNIEYIREANRRNIKVWALFSNDFNSPSLTSKFLENKDARRVLNDKLLSICVSNNIDGINIDFERIYKKDIANYLSFVKELSKKFKEKGKVVSVDISVVQSGDFNYDSNTLGELTDAVDYVVIMAYDQFWSGSKVAGPVASLDWVENNLKKHIKMNANTGKIILGVPFYSRLWEEKSDAKGNVSVSGKVAVTMQNAKNIVKQSRSFSKWDKQSGQYYITFKKNGSNFKLWIEDENSIELRTALTLKYNLAGVACWNRSFEIPAVWPIINRNLKEFKSYDEWKKSDIERRLIID